MSKQIGIIGLGIMGSAISANFIKSGYEVIGCDIDSTRCSELKNKGGTIAETPKEVASSSEIILTSLPSSAALDEVISGDDGIAASKNSEASIMECSTLPIKDKQRNHDILSKVGMTLLDTPLSGTGAQAITKDLAVYISGNEKAANNCFDIIDGFARAFYYVGKFGNGSRMKYIANHLVAIHNVAAAEALVLGMKAELDPQLILFWIKMVVSDIVLSNNIVVKFEGLYEEDFSDTGGPFFSKLFRLYNNEILFISGYVNNPGKSKYLLLKELEVLIDNFKL